jgi:hypothetical protein
LAGYAVLSAFFLLLRSLPHHFRHVLSLAVFRWQKRWRTINVQYKQHPGHQR